MQIMVDNSSVTSPKLSKVRLADVAKKAGVSKTAASFALSGSWEGKLSKETAERTIKAARDLGYKPNFAAKTLRTQMTSTIGFLSTEVSVTRWATDLISGALLESNKFGYAMLIGECKPSSGDAAESTSTEVEFRRQAELTALIDRQVDGLIVAELVAKQVRPPDISSELRTVYLNCLGPESAVSILPDETRAGEELVNHLIDYSGANKVLILGSHPELERDLGVSATIGDRLRAIRNTLQRRGVEFEEVPGRNWGAEFGYASFEKKFAQSKAQAVISLNDQIGFGVYQAAQANGLQPGVDFSIVSFDDDELSRLTRPKLTTARLPFAEMGRLAIQALLDPLAEPGVKRVPMPIQIRGSVAMAE